MDFKTPNKKSNKKIQNSEFRVAFQTGPNLKNILCKNKDKLIPNTHPGVHELNANADQYIKMKQKRKSEDQSNIKKRASNVIGHLLVQRNT